MRIRLAVRGTDLHPSLKTLVESYLWLAISRYQEEISDAWATLAEICEASGSRVKHCRLDIVLNDGGKITIEDRDVRPEAAVQRIGERSFRMLRRHFEGKQAVEPAEPAVA